MSKARNVLLNSTLLLASIIFALVVASVFSCNNWPASSTSFERQSCFSF
jgi:hypothetical protein